MYSEGDFFGVCRPLEKEVYIQIMNLEGMGVLSSYSGQAVIT